MIPNLIPSLGLVNPSTATTRAGRTQSDFVLKERGGRRRTLRLTREAKPLQGLEVERISMESVSRSQGSIDATVQKFGPNWGPLELRGLWKTVWLSRDIATIEEGGSRRTITSTVEMDSEFTSLWAEGQDLDLVWESLAFRVTISRFKTRWVRREDAEWELTLTVIGPGLTEAQLEFAAEWNYILDSGTLFARLSGYLSTARKAIAGLLAYERACNEYLDRVALLGRELQATIAAAGSLASAPARLARRAYSTGKNLGGAWGSIVSAINEVDSSYAANGTTGVALSESQRARIAVVQAARDGQKDAFATALAARRSYQASIRRVLVATDATDLRRLALDEYGDQSAWKDIADASGVTTPTPAAGTTILVPDRTF